MTKMLLIGLVAITVLGGIIYFRFRSSQPVSSAKIEFKQSNGSAEERLRGLEEVMAILISKVNNISDELSGGKTSSSLNNKIAELETAVSNLEKQVQNANLPTITQTSVSQTVKLPSQYIPLNWYGTSSALDWTVISGQEMELDPADFPGYTSMQFSAQIKVRDSNGRGYARIYNSHDGTSILSSEISTTSADYIFVSSEKFTLPGKKTYKLQLKSLSGYPVSIQYAVIKVNF